MMKKTGALVLVIAMTLSLFTEPAMALRAARTAGVLPAAAESAVPLADPDPSVQDFGSADRGRPNLYVDFLGDNGSYDAPVTALPTPWSTSTAEGNRTTPDAWRYSPTTKSGLFDGSNAVAAGKDAVFWVGVGIDRMNLLKLLEQNEGLYSVELGFYYNPKYVEPYQTDAASYAAALTEFNIAKGGHEWGNQYSVITAVPDADPLMDPVTQEVIQDPNNDAISAAANGWKMTYVALEKQVASTANSRFNGLYDGKFHPVDDSDTASNAATNYILLIPFRLKAYDPQEKLCFRLARNATAFSIGAGKEQGHVDYAAWERVTTRNPGRDLKLLTNFTGDLNIFTGQKVLEAPYTARLDVDLGGSAGNKVAMTVTGDTSPVPVEVTKDEEKITGLYGGTGLTVKVAPRSGFSVKVTAEADASPGVLLPSFVTVTDKKEYTFVMPEGDVTVHVVFAIDPDAAQDYQIYLKEDRTQEVPISSADDAKVSGNVTTITNKAGDKIDSATAPDTNGDIALTESKDNTFTMEVACHGDYYAELTVQNLAGGWFTPAIVGADSPGAALAADGHTVTIPSGAKLTLAMPGTDVTVAVTYKKAAVYKANLLVSHAASTAYQDDNQAQLSYPGRLDDNSVAQRYSGIFKDALLDDLLVSDAEAIAPVKRSAAANSGSLAGDRDPWTMDELMRMASRAAANDDSTAELAAKVTAEDLTALDLRKNDKGEWFTAADMTAFYNAIIAAAKKGAGDTDYEVTEGTAPDTVKYVKLDANQLQLWLLDTVLKPAANAATDVNAYRTTESWPVLPTPDVSDQPYIETRDGRTVTVSFRANSAYTVSAVTVTEKNPAAGATARTVTATASPDHVNEYTFTMPDYEVNVEVTFALRAAHNVKLVLNNAGGKAGNTGTVTGYGADSTSRYPAVLSTSANGGAIAVFDGSKVTVRVGKDSGYTVSAAVKKDLNGDSVSTSLASLTNLGDGTEFTFTMPAGGDVTVTLTYTPTEASKHRAEIKFDHLTATEVGAGDQALWDDGTEVKADVAVGTPLTGQISVEPGYYIYAVTVRSAAGSYPYVLSGNGYNNGAGAGGDTGFPLVNLDLTMPDADIVAEVIFAKGPPPEEPDLSVTLTVEDPDNPGGATPAENWAALAVADGTAGRHVTHNSGAYTTYAKAGDLLTVQFHTDTGYYVESVTVSPAYLGAYVTWTGTDTVTLPMPAGDANVTVRFQKGTTPPTFGLTVQKTEPDPGNNGNHITDITTSVTHTTAEGIAPGSLPQTIAGIRAGETVTVGSITAAEGYYLRGVRASHGGYLLPVTLTDAPGGGKTASFVMPNGPVTFTADFRAGTAPTVPERTVTLWVDDPDNTDDPAADNWAKLYVNGVAQNGGVAIKKDGFVTVDVKAGDSVRVEYGQGAGFTGGPVSVTPSGLGVIPSVPDLGAATFTMPDADASVRVPFRRGTDQRYTANLILRAPGGVNVGDAGKGTFSYVGGATAGTLADPVYSVTANPGERVGLALFSMPGYYIDSIVVTPSQLGVEESLSGAIATQGGEFLMPAANVTVNVYLKAGWPDQVRYNATLSVTDATGNGGNCAKLSGFLADGTADEATADLGPGRRGTITAPENERMTVDFKLADPDTYQLEVRVTDAAGKNIPFAWGAPIEGSGYDKRILFAMPAGHVNVEAVYKTDAPKAYNVTLHISGNADDKVLMQNIYNNQKAEKDGESLQAMTGQMLTLGAYAGNYGDDAARYVQSVLVLCGGELIAFDQMLTEGDTFKAADFVMPDGDTDVYVYFQDRNVVPPVAGEYAAAVRVTATDDSGVKEAGEATIQALPAPAAASPRAATLSATAFSNDDPAYITVTQDNKVQVDATAYTQASGLSAKDYTVSDIRFTPVGSTMSYPVAFTWIDSDTVQFTMPPEPVAVEVVLDDVTPPTYKAEVVVQNEDHSLPTYVKNGAAIKKNSADPAASLIYGLSAGDQVLLDLSVGAGYELELVQVVPMTYGGQPVLGPIRTVSQGTSFNMPASDVVIHVKFKTDSLDRFNATLDVVGTPGVAGNKASIASGYSGTEGPIDTDMPPVSVQAAAAVEWVYVEYYIETGYRVESVSIRDQGGLGVDVPFTQVDPTHIQFPMVASDVKVTVEFTNTAEPKGYEAVLHVLSADGTAGGYASLTYADDPAVTTGNINAGEADATIKAPAGKTVDLSVTPDGASHIRAAYVLYGGQMILCNLPGFGGTQASSFQMHPGRNDVYVYFEGDTAPPDPVEYASVLTLVGPDETDAVTKSTAEMARSGAAEGESAVGVTSNGSHGYLTATAGETITVTVKPGPGLEIAGILMTPLGIAVTPVRTGDAYVFTMPAQNVAARVTLRERTSDIHTATLHLLKNTGSGLSAAAAGIASISYTDAGNILQKADADGGSISAPETQEIDFRAVAVPAGMYVEAAYVMKDGTMVPMDKAFEGLEHNDSPAHPGDPDGAAVFTMPDGDVDVYFILKDGPRPVADWRTLVVVVEDEGLPGGLANTGTNSVDVSSPTDIHPAVPVKSDGLRTHYFTIYETDERVTVKVNVAAPGFVFAPPVVLSASGATVPSLTQADPSYSFDMPAYNAAAYAYFQNTDVTANGLRVVVVDADNPGNGTVENKVTAEPDGMTELTVRSTTPAGAVQTIPSVAENKNVTVTVTPSEGYVAYARLTYGDTKQVLAVDSGTASFPMPAQGAVLTVWFYEAKTATLVMADSSGAKANVAHMAEGYSGGTVVVGGKAADGTDNPVTGKLERLPAGTDTNTTLTLAADSQLVGVLLNERDATTRMTSDTEGNYRHTMARADATVTVVAEDKDSSNPSYLATVTVTGRKAGDGNDAAIVNETYPDAQKGEKWTAAKKDDKVKLTVTVAPGYEAAVTAKTADGTAITLTQDSFTVTGEATFTMLNQHAEVTVAFRRTSFKATLVVEDKSVHVPGENLVTMSSGANTTSGGDITVKKDDPVTTVVGPLAVGAVLTGVTLTTASGTRVLAPGAGNDYSFPMPAEDVTVTVFISKAPSTADPDPVAETFLATVVADETTTGDLPDNRANTISNESRPTDPALGKGTIWTTGYENNQLLVSFTTEPGWYATLKAQKVDADGTPGDSVPILQQGVTGKGTGSLNLPASDVLVTVSYSQAAPTDTSKLTLRLVGHGGAAGNKALLTAPGGDVALAGNETDCLETTADPLSPVKKDHPATVKVGEELELSADWTAGYVIEKITVSSGGVESELPYNTYESNGAALLKMPGDEAVVTVYYKQVYFAELRIVDSTDLANEVALETEGRDAISANGAKLDNLGGMEPMTTTVTTADDTKVHVVGVIKTTPRTGTVSIGQKPEESDPNIRFFDMPEENTVVTAVLEPVSDNPSYLAKVALMGESTQPGNRVEIVNTSDDAAKAGDIWTAARAGEKGKLTVHLAEGYQAKIYSAVQDSDGTTIVYVSRLSFLSDGQTATFTMPADNITITVEFIKGYTATLELKDTSAGNNTAQMGVNEMATVTGQSAGGNLIGTVAGVTYGYSGTDGNRPNVNSVEHIPATTTVTANLTTQTGTKVLGVVYHNTNNGGTQNMPKVVANQSYSLPMPAEDTIVSVILGDVNDPAHLAKVALAGESGINGNEVVITNDTDTAAAKGTIWTKARGAEPTASPAVDADTVKVTVNLAPDYTATLKAVRDNDGVEVPLNALAVTTSGDAVTFVMPADTDVTVTVTFLTGFIPKPNDPERAAADPLVDGSIYGENNGSHAVLKVPTLLDEDGATLHSTDRYDPADLDTKVHYELFIYNKTADTYTKLIQPNPDKPSDPADIVLSQAVPDDSGDRYNYYDYTYSTKKYTGSHFRLDPIPTETPSNQLKALLKILDNDGSVDETNKEVSLFITAVDETGRTSDYVQVEIPKYYSLTGQLISYAPKHRADFALYRLKDEAGLDVDDPESYEAEPAFTDFVQGDMGKGLWQQDFAIRSSELVEGAGPHIFKLVIQKPGHVPYTRVNIELSADDADADLAIPLEKMVDGAAVPDPITLLVGDTDGDRYVKWNDYNVLADFLSKRRNWTQATDDTDPEKWADSVYNPESLAHLSDLDGDGFLSIEDVNILMDPKHMNKSEIDYYIGGKLPSGRVQADPTASATMDELEEESVLPPEEEPAPPETPEVPSLPEVPTVPEEPAGEGDAVPGGEDTGGDAVTPPSESTVPPADGTEPPGSGEQAQPDGPSVEATPETPSTDGQETPLPPKEEEEASQPSGTGETITGT